MRIEIDKSLQPREFYQEFIDIRSQYKLFLKNPRRKLRRMTLTQIALIAFAAFYALLIIVGILAHVKTSSIVMYIAIWLLIVLGIIYIFMIRRKQIEQLMSKKSTQAAITMDDEGISLGSQASSVRMGWDSVAFARVFDNSLVIFGKEDVRVLMGICRVYETPVLDYLRTNHPSIPIYS